MQQRTKAAPVWPKPRQGQRPERPQTAPVTLDPRDLKQVAGGLAATAPRGGW